MSGCVIVTGPPVRIWLRKIGTTLQRLPSTLPNGTDTKLRLDFRAQPGELSRHSTADRAARPGAEHRAAGRDRPDALEVRLHRLAAEQVLDLDLAKLSQADAPREDLEQRRNRARGDLCVHRRPDDASYDGARGTGHCDHDLLDAVRGNDGRDRR